MNGSSATIGAKLQALVDADCISSNAAGGLPATQKAAIEGLTQAQIDVLKEVHKAVGKITNSNFI